MGGLVWYGAADSMHCSSLWKDAIAMKLGSQEKAGKLKVPCLVQQYLKALHLTAWSFLSSAVGKAGFTPVHQGWSFKPAVTPL